MKKINSNYVRLQIRGLNIEKLLNSLNDKKISIYNIYRQEHNLLTLTISENDIKYIEQYGNALDVQTISTYGIKSTYTNLINKIGLVIGVFISIVSIIVLNMFTLHINIVGIENISKQEVLLALKSYGVDTWKINNYNNDDLCNYLVQSIDNISLVSTKRVGTTIIVNIKEKSTVLEETAENYIAPFNMIINNYSINSGIGNISLNKMVKKGDIIIYPEEYLDKDGVLHLIAPKATLDVTIFKTATDVFFKEETIYKKTGNKIRNFKYSMGNITLYSSEKANSFEYWEMENNEFLISDILPIKYQSSTYFETVPEVVKNDFENSREKIIANLKSIVYNNIGDNEEVKDETCDIIELNDRYIINYYLQCNTKIIV